MSVRQCPYVAYYKQQAGAGVSHVYSGASYQKGHGIGSFLGSLFRWVTPLLRKGAIAVGHKAVDMGGKVLGDVTAGESFKASAKKRWNEIQGGHGARRNIKRKTKGHAVSRAPAAKKGRPNKDRETDKLD